MSNIMVSVSASTGFEDSWTVADADGVAQVLRDNAGFLDTVPVGGSVIANLTRTERDVTPVPYGAGGSFQGTMWVDVSADGENYLYLGEITVENLAGQIEQFASDYDNASEVVITMARPGAMDFGPDYEDDETEEQDSYGPEQDNEDFYASEDDEDVDNESPVKDAEEPTYPPSKRWGFPLAITSDDFISIVQEALYALPVGDVFDHDTLSTEYLNAVAFILGIGKRP